jgi:hypothetical protein
MSVEPTASLDGAYWIVFDYEGSERFYSSHDKQEDALMLCSKINAEEQDRVRQYADELARGLRRFPYLPKSFRVRTRPS